MKVLVPFHYSVKYSPRGRSQEMSATFASQGEIEIREVPRSAVRPVMRVRRNGYWERAWTDYSTPIFMPKFDGSRREIVSYDGDMWVEFGPAADVASRLSKGQSDGTPFSTLRIDHSSRVSKDAPRIVPLTSKAQVQDRARKDIRRDLRHDAGDPLRLYVDDGGEARRQELAKYADAVISVDGMAYLRCREPVASIEPDGQGSIVVKLIDGRPVYGDSKHRFGEASAYNYDHAVRTLWPVSTIDVAIAHIEKQSGPKPVVGRDDIEVIDPALCAASPHVSSVLRSAADVMEKLLSNVHGLSHAMILKGAALRDALAECGGQITKPVIRCLSEIASSEPLSQEDLARWEQMRGRRGVTQSQKSRADLVVEAQPHVATAIELARGALERFDLRPQGMSWEVQALEPNAIGNKDPRSEGVQSRELLSREAVFAEAASLGVATEAPLQLAQDGTRIFSVGIPYANYGGDEFAGQAMVCVEVQDDVCKVVAAYGKNGAPVEDAVIDLVSEHLMAAGLAPLHTPEREMAPALAMGG